VIVDLEGMDPRRISLSVNKPIIDVTPLGAAWSEHMLIDFGNYWNQAPFSLEQAIILPTDLSIECSVGNLERIRVEGFLQISKEYKLVAARCHLCFAPLVKEGSERERELKTGCWIERATGEYSCGTTVVFEPDKKLAVTPGAKVRIGPKCVKLLKKK
jgi:hypothetical protein